MREQVVSAVVDSSTSMHLFCGRRRRSSSGTASRLDVRTREIEVVQSLFELQLSPRNLTVTEWRIMQVGATSRRDACVVSGASSKRRFGFVPFRRVGPEGAKSFLGVQRIMVSYWVR